MKRNPLYAFKDGNSIGVFNIPLNSTIHILDDSTDGTGNTRFVEIISKTGLNPGSTIAQFLANPDLYIDLSNENISPSQLQKIEVDGKTGWRILGRDPNNYGEIGDQAIDLSLSLDSGSVNGATGYNSFAVGLNVEASEDNSVVFGNNTKSNYYGETVFGSYNVDPQSSVNGPTKFVVGIGTNWENYQNGFEVYTNGVVRAPSCSIAEIAASDEKTLVTKEYADDIDGGDLT